LATLAGCSESEFVEPKMGSHAVRDWAVSGEYIEVWDEELNWQDKIETGSIGDWDRPWKHS
jgi:hypothetical protein